METVIKHPWSLTELEALQLQQDLARQVVKYDQFKEIKFIAGTDVGYSKENNGLVAAVIILDAITLKVVETVTAKDVVNFPYIPGLFSFRELPPLIKAFSKLKHTPDLIICDGQGYSHPRRFGLACHLGLIYDLPSIGCGKNRLLGEHDEVNIKRGSITPLIDNGEVIGNVLRTQSNVKPVYVSIGHKISLATATSWVLNISPKYRLPESTREADQAVRKALNCNSSDQI